MSYKQESHAHLLFPHDVEIDGAVQIDSTLTVGVDDTGYDVTFFGDTASRYWLWDTSGDGVVQRGTLTVGVNDVGHDVKFFGATAGSYLLWDESEDDLLIVPGSANNAGLIIGHTARIAIGNGVNPATQILGIDGSGSAFSIVRNSADAYPPELHFAKSRGTTVGAHGTLSNNDEIARIEFDAADDDSWNVAAYIRVFADAAHGADADAPARMTFETTAASAADPTERMRITSAGNILIGGTANHGTTVGAAALSIFNGTPPAGTLTNGASFFCASGEMKVIDAAGNITVLSPHDDDGRWIYHSKNSVTGKVLHVHMEKLVRKLEEKFGWGFVEEFTEEI
jgi:hypothetical protein